MPAIPISESESYDANEPQQPPRGRALMFGLGALVFAQLFAFWLLCSHQVRKAEARSTEEMVRAMALSDCLKYIPGSTIASCSIHIDSARASVPAGAAPTVNGATPVSYSFQ